MKDFWSGPAAGQINLFLNLTPSNPTMKICFYLALLLLLAGCKKSGSTGSDSQPPYTVTPAPVQVNTSISAYAPFYQYRIKQLGIYAGTQLPYSGVYIYNPASYGYDLTNVRTDKLASTLKAKGESFDALKTFTVSNALANYVDVATPSVSIAGGYNPINPALFSLPANGKLTVPAYSFYGATDMVQVDLYCSYLVPSAANYAVTIPCYPMADENNKRWFLDSYGAYNLQPFKGGLGVLDFKPGITALLQMEIPADKLATAPDSIAAYHISPYTNLWEKQATAFKKGNYYEATINHTGYWNLAKPVPGVYVVIHLVSAADKALPNTRMTIKSGANEIADARTDANGNAQVFVPVAQKLTLDITNDHYDDHGREYINGLAVGSFNTSAEQTVKIPERQDLISFDAAIFNCDGTPMNSGTAVLSLAYSKDKYIFPVANGRLKASNWISYGYNPGTLIIKDNAGNNASSNFIVLSGTRTNVNTLALYGCSDAQKLYCNYYIDGTPFSIATDAQAATPILTETDYPNLADVIRADNNKTGIMFQCGARTIQGNYYLNGGPYLPTGLRINGADCIFDNTVTPLELQITRRDNAIGGFIEGWFSFGYRDGANKLHTAQGDFRVKRN